MSSKRFQLACGLITAGSSVLRSTKDRSHIIAQGSLDRRVDFDGFRLLGARKNDMIVFVGADDRGPLAVQCAIEGSAAGDDGELQATIGPWAFVTPDVLPMVDVLPEPVKSGDLMAHIKVRITSAGALPDQVWPLPARPGAGRE